MSNFIYDHQTFNYPVDIKDKKEYQRLFKEFYDFMNSEENRRKRSLEEKEYLSRFYAVNALLLANT